jgi:hypothetical protein
MSLSKAYLLKSDFERKTLGKKLSAIFLLLNQVAEKVGVGEEPEPEPEPEPCPEKKEAKKEEKKEEKK